MKYICYLILVFGIYSCNNSQKNEDNELTTIKDSTSGSRFNDENYFQDKELMDSLYNKIINEGDTIAYNEAYNISAVSFNGDKFYYYSQIMAVKYSSSKAYYNMFINFRYKGDELQKLSIYYLLKAYELGSKDAKNDVKFIFKDSEIPKADFYFMKKDSIKKIEIPVY